MSVYSSGRFKRCGERILAFVPRARDADQALALGPVAGFQDAVREAQRL